MSNAVFRVQESDQNYYNKYRVELFIHASVQSYYQTKYKTKPTQLILPSFQPQHCSRIKQFEISILTFSRYSSCKLFDPLKVILINYQQQTYDSQTLPSISLCTQLGTYSIHPIGYTLFVPNQVYELCTKLDNYIHDALEQGLCLRKPNLEYRLCTRLGTLWFAPNWVQEIIYP